MSFRSMCVSALLIFAFSHTSRAQSLGDVARQIRAEREKTGMSHPRVITNDDISSSKPQSKHLRDATEEVSSKDAGEPAKTSATTDTTSEGTTAAAGEATTGKKQDQAGPEPAKEHETEIQKRTDEIDKRYLDRISALRAQINSSQLELSKLQKEKVESTYQFQRSAGASPTLAAYEDEQRSFNEQIEAHQKLIEGLNSQLEDAREAARHAGVPHALDY